MTPRSLSRIHEDDELLDALGGRGSVSDDGLPGMLQAWVTEIDTTPGAVRRTGTKRRHAMRVAGAGGLVLATLSISSVAAAVSGTDVPVLHQLGQVANAFWDDGGDQRREAGDQLPPETSIDGGELSGSSSAGDGQSGVPGATDSRTPDSARPGSSATSDAPGTTASSSRSARPSPSDLPRVPAPRSTNPGAVRPPATSAPSSPRTPRPTSTSVPRPTSTSSPRPSSSSSAPSSSSTSSSSSSSTPSSSSSAPSSTRPSPTSTRTKPAPKPKPTKKFGPRPTDKASDPGRRIAPPVPTDAPGMAPSASEAPSPTSPIGGESSDLPPVLHAEADL